MDRISHRESALIYLLWSGHTAALPQSHTVMQKCRNSRVQLASLRRNRSNRSQNCRATDLQNKKKQQQQENGSESEMVKQQANILSLGFSSGSD